ncbi:hypothetical protein [Spirosoma sp. 209]|uniref:hypothetical protein n=1 Tax=Spirosoma sp. 209 TaxID=1955701 RepID=UPI00098D543A|nr:hypothetical protein [Spirosoma sp. 209]
MKTRITLIVSFMLLTLIASVSLAKTIQTGNPEKKTFQTGNPEKKTFQAAMYPAAASSKVWLALEKSLPQFKVNVELIDQKGNVLFRETLPGKGGKSNRFRQMFDLSDVEDGNYTFRVYTAGFQSEEFSFRLSTPTVTQRLPTRLVSMK